MNTSLTRLKMLAYRKSELNMHEHQELANGIEKHGVEQGFYSFKQQKFVTFKEWFGMRLYSDLVIVDMFDTDVEQLEAA